MGSRKAMFSLQETRTKLLSANLVRRAWVQRMLSENEQEAYLLSRIGNPVNFKYPEPPTHRKGRLLDRYVTKVHDDQQVNYWYVMDRIRFEHIDEEWLRVTYYRYKKRERRWVFAGQTSLCGPASYLKKLYVGAIESKDWVRAFFTEICRAT